MASLNTIYIICSLVISFLDKYSCNMLKKYFQCISMYQRTIIWIFVTELRGFFQTVKSILCPPLWFRCTGGIHWQLVLDASISMTEAEICLNETDRDCLIKGRISMVSLGPGPRCHGIGGHYWTRKNTERQEGRQCHLSMCLVIHNLFCLPGLNKLYHRQIHLKSNCERNST